MSSRRAIGYVRVSTDEQHASGAGLAAQRAVISAEAERRDWDLVDVVSEEAGASAVTLDRPGLRSVLARLEEVDSVRTVDILVVAKLDRLSRSVSQGSELMERAREHGWELVALDFGLDTTTPAGELVASVILATAQYERRLAGQRTREALAARQAAGVRLGRPRELSDDVLRRIVDERRNGASLSAIARALSAEGVPTARGGVRWYASTVRAALHSQDARALERDEQAMRPDTVHNSTP